MGLVPITKTKTILGVTFAAVFVFAMMINPVFAVSPNLKIDSVDGLGMTVVGKAPGHGVDDHLVIVYAFFTDAEGGEEGSFVAQVGAVHPELGYDDTEQDVGIPIIHQHELWLDSESLCVVGLDVDADPEITVEGSTITVENPAGGEVTAHVIAGYDFTDDGLCPTEVYSFQAVTSEE